MHFCCRYLAGSVFDYSEQLSLVQGTYKVATVRFSRGRSAPVDLGIPTFLVHIVYNFWRENLRLCQTSIGINCKANLGSSIYLCKVLLDQSKFLLGIHFVADFRSGEENKLGLGLVSEL